MADLPELPASMNGGAHPPVPHTQPSQISLHSRQAGTGTRRRMRSTTARANSPRSARVGYTGLDGISYSLPGATGRFMLPGGCLTMRDGLTGDLEVWPAGSKSSPRRRKPYRPVRQAPTSSSGETRGGRQAPHHRGMSATSRPTTIAHPPRPGLSVPWRRVGGDDLDHRLAAEEYHSAYVEAPGGMGNTVSRPRLLQDIEDFIADELSFLGCDPPLAADEVGGGSSGGGGRGSEGEARLQVYREAFDQFMAQFTTYRPLLRRIKTEYDRLISAYGAQLRQVPVLRARLSTIAAETEQRIAGLQNGHRHQLREADRQLDELSRRCDELKSAHSALESRCAEQRKDVRTAQARYLDMKTANLTLTNALKRHDESMLKQQQTMVRGEGEANSLRQQLDKMTLDHERLRHALFKLQEKMKHMVAKDTFNSLKAELAGARLELRDKCRQCDQLLEEQARLTTRLSEADALSQRIASQGGEAAALFADVPAAGGASSAGVGGASRAGSGSEGGGTAAAAGQGRAYRNGYEAATPRPEWPTLIEDSGLPITAEGRSTVAIVDELFQTIAQLEYQQGGGGEGENVAATGLPPPATAAPAAGGGGGGGGAGGKRGASTAAIEALMGQGADQGVDQEVRARTRSLTVITDFKPGGTTRTAVAAASPQSPSSSPRRESRSPYIHSPGAMRRRSTRIDPRALTSAVSGRGGDSSGDVMDGKNAGGGATNAGGADGGDGVSGWAVDGSRRQRRSLLATGKPQAREPYFQGLGTDPLSVPAYLRINGRVRNYRISKRQVERFIRQIWIARESEKTLIPAVGSGSGAGKGGRGPAGPTSPTSTHRPGQTTHESSLADFMHMYLKSKYRSVGLVAETAYNILHGLRMFRYDADCELFLAILEGDLPEDVHADQVTVFRDLQDGLVKRDRELHGGKRMDRIQVDDFIAVVEKKCPTKRKEDIAALRRALAFEVRGSHEVNYFEVFGEDKDGNQGRVCEALRDQHLKEITGYVDELVTFLAKRNIELGGTGVMTVKQYREAISEFDPGKPSHEVYEYVGRGCKTAVPFLDDVNEYPASSFVEHLKLGLCKRSTHATR